MKKAHILIVDDVAENIQVAMNILKEDDYDFTFATGGMEALTLLENDVEKYDLILLDIMMPGLDGFTVCKILSENTKTSDIPVIFLTAKVGIEALSKGFSTGAVDYISKPFHSEELLARVKVHIQLYQAKRLLKKYNLSLETKVEHEKERLLTELEGGQKEMIVILAELMEATSDETGKHIQRVAKLAKLFARYHPALSIDDEELLSNASPMHDIGKMTVPYDVLHKSGRYTEGEFIQMKAHTTNAYKLLSGSERELIKTAATIAHEHHEKWDGTGYPRQLKGTEIHIFGRIIALVDVLDALTHQRCYKEAWSFDEALDYVKAHKGTQFDPELVGIFLKHLDEFKAIVEIQ